MRNFSGRTSAAAAALTVCLGIAGPTVRVGASPAAEAVTQQPVELTVVTYNIRHGQACVVGEPDDGQTQCDRPPPPSDLLGIAEALVPLEPDVVLLQEVDQFHEDSGCVDQPRRIAELLEAMTNDPDWHYVMGENRTWNNNGTICDSADTPDWYRGNAVLSRTAIPEHYNTGLPFDPQLPDTPSTCPVEGAGENDNHCLLRALVEVPARGFLWMSSTHLETDPALRDAQVRYLAANFPPTNDAPILAGDFNLRPRNFMHQVVEEAGWVDSYVELLGDTGVDCPDNREVGCTHTSVNPHKRIDYVFHSPSVEAVSTIFSSSYASDHLPVQITLSLAS